MWLSMSYSTWKAGVYTHLTSGNHAEIVAARRSVDAEQRTVDSAVSYVQRPYSASLDASQSKQREKDPYVWKCVDDGDHQGCGAVMKTDNPQSVRQHRQSQLHARGIALGAPDMSKGIRGDGWHCVDDGDKLGCGVVLLINNSWRCIRLTHLTSPTHVERIAEWRRMDAEQNMADVAVSFAQRRRVFFASLDESRKPRQLVTTHVMTHMRCTSCNETRERVARYVDGKFVALQHDREQHGAGYFHPTDKSIVVITQTKVRALNLRSLVLSDKQRQAPRRAAAGRVNYSALQTVHWKLKLSIERKATDAVADENALETGVAENGGNYEPSSANAANAADVNGNADVVNNVARLRQLRHDRMVAELLKDYYATNGASDALFIERTVAGLNNGAEPLLADVADAMSPADIELLLAIETDSEDDDSDKDDDRSDLFVHPYV
jgi:hypothetical protein